jgi:hypothetical protein
MIAVRVKVVASLLVSGLIGTAGAAPAQAPQSPSAAQREIQPLLDDEVLAANAHDTDRFLTAYLHDSTLVFIFNGVVTRGFNALHDQQLKAWNNGPSDVMYSLRGPTDYTVLTPGIVLATMLLTSHRTLPTGETRTTELTVSMVWQKRPEGWRIIQAYESSLR